MLAGPEGAEGTVLAERIVFALLMWTTQIALRDDDILDAISGEESLDLLGDLRIADDVRADKTLEDWFSRLVQDHARGYFGRSLIIRAVEGHGSDRELSVSIRLGFGRAAELVLRAAAAWAQFIRADF